MIKCKRCGNEQAQSSHITIRIVDNGIITDNNFEKSVWFCSICTKELKRMFE